MFCEGFFSFFFTPNVLMYSGLHEVGEGVKAINENRLMCGCVRSYAYARDARGCACLFVNWGERWKSGEECERKWGRGEDKGGMRDGRGVDPKREMEEGVSEGESPNWEEGLVMRKGGVRRKKGGAISRKIAEIGFKWGRSRKKSTSRGKKTGAVPRKIARNRVQNGEGQEKRRFRDEKDGVGER